MENQIHRASAGPESGGHETSDAAVRPILITGIVLAVTAAIVFAIGVGLFRYFVERPAETPPNPMAASSPPFPPAPRIEEHPSTEVEQLHAYENQVLSSYGWVDRKSGVVRIPIERAMELQLQRGFPTRKETAKK